MKIRLQLLLVLLLILASGKYAMATHVMGGDLTYKHLHDSTYELKFLVYRDCNNGQANIDASIKYWVYYNSNKKVYNYGRRVYLSSKGVFKVNPEAPNCVVPSGVCIEAGEYIDTVTLGGDPDGYLVTWYRLERNHDIDNLSRCVQSSDNTSCTPTFTRPCSATRNRPFGMVWTAEIPSYTFKNSSPQFLTAPVPYFCKGITNFFNHVAFDPDGDSLYYENVTPLSPEECLDAAPNTSQSNPPESVGTIYQSVTYQSGYSVTKPFGATSATIKVDSETGEITANPTSNGNYVIAIKISEYRVDPVTKKAKYLGSIRRDLQFIAGSCPSNTPPKLTSGSKNTYYVDPDSTLTFTISGSDNQDTLSLKGVGNIFGGQGSTISQPYAVFRDTSSFKTISQTFTWTPTCDHITYTSPHVISIFLSDEGCNTLQRTISIYVNPKPILGPPTITCLTPTSSGGLQVTWKKPSTLKNAFKQYNIYRKNPDGSRTLVKSIADSTVTTYADNSISDADSKLYLYYLKTENACNLDGLPSDSLQNVIVSASEINDKEVELSWNRFTPVGTVYYFVQKKIANAFVNIDTTTQLSTTIKGCDLSGTYRVFPSLTANMSSCTSTSNEVAVTTKDVTGPSAPTLSHITYENWNRVRMEIKKSSSSDIEKYSIIRSDNGGSYSTIASITSLASSITYIDNLSNNGNNSFCYKVIAIDACSVVGDTSTMHCPVNLAARTGQLESILEWKNYVGYDLDSVTIQRYDTLQSRWKYLATISNGATLYKDTKDIVCNFLYTYRLVSHQKDGNFASLSDSAFARPIDTIRPPQIDIITTGITSNSTAIVGYLRSVDADVNKHMVVSRAYYNNKLVSTDTSYTLDTSPDTISQTIATPRADSFQYRFEVYAIDSCNENVSSTAEEHRAVQLTGKPANLAAELAWTPYQGYTINQYIVQIFDGSDWKNLSTVLPTSPKYTHMGLPCNVEQRYRVLAVGNPLKKEVSVSDEIRLIPYDSLPPASPPINYVTVVNDTTIEINWAHSTSGDAQNYLLFYGRNGGAPILIDTITRNNSLTSHTYRHTGLDTRKNTYCYDVVAYDTCNTNFSQNNVTHCAIQLSGSPGNKKNDLSWSQYVGASVNTYEIQRLANNTWTTVSSVSGSTTSYSHNNLDCYKPYAYRIKMTETGSNPDVSVSDTLILTPFDTIPPVTPVIRSVSVVAEDTVELKWDHSASNDVDRYIIYMKHPDSSGFSIHDTVGYVNSQKIAVDKIEILRSYGFAIRAIDVCQDNTSTLSQATYSLYIRAVPVDCKSQLQVTWVNDPRFKNGVGQYELYRSTNGGSYQLITITTGTSYTDNISPYAKYKYRVRAVESGSTGFDAHSHEIDGIPYRPWVPEVKAASVTETDATQGEVTITWSNLPSAPYLESQRIYYKPASGGSFAILANNLPLTDSSYVHKGINTKTAGHQYFVVNVDSCGNVSDTFSIHRSMDMKFKIGQLTHELSWTPYQGFAVSSYYVQQLIGNQYTYTDTVPAADDSLYKFPAPCNSVITYRIVAESNLGHLAFSDTTSGQAIDNELPDAPVLTNVSVVNSVYNKIHFIGVDSPDVFAYSVLRSRDGNQYNHRGYVYYNGVKKPEFFNDTTNTSSGPFCYVVMALDSCLNPGLSDTFCTFHLTGKGDHFSNKLQWTSFSGYELGSLSLQYLNGSNWSTLKTLTTLDSAYTHDDIGCNQPVTYRIMGVSKTNADTTLSNPLSLTPIDTTLPAQPKVLYASVNHQNEVELNWLHNPNSDIKTYEVYRSTNGGGFSLLGDTVYSGKYFDHSSDARNNLYEYYIKAIDSCDVTHISPVSDTVSTFNYELRKDTCSTINYFTWSQQKRLGDGVDKYVVHRMNQKTSVWEVLDTVDAAGNSYVDTTSKRNQSYCFRIEAIDQTTGLSSFTDTFCHKQTIFNEPVAPNMFVASVSGSDTKKGHVELKWDALTTTQERNLKGYLIYRSDTINGTFTLQGQTTGRFDTLFYDTANTSNNRYFYRIAALNECNVRGDSSLLHAPIQLNVGGLNFAAELSWTEYLGFDVNTYRIERSVNSAPYQTIGTVPRGTYEFVDNLVSCGDLLNYRVVATHGSNPTLLAYSDVESTLGTDTIPPATNSLVNATTVNDGEDFEISWALSPEPDVESYTISGKAKNNAQWITLGTDIKGSSFLAKGINPQEGEVYEFRVAPKDSCGNAQTVYSSAHNSIGLTAIGSSGFVKLEWTNYRGWTPQTFNIYRDGKLVTTYSAGTSQADSIYELNDTLSACDSTQYEYFVEAVGALGQTSISNYDTALTIDRAVPWNVYIKTATTLSSGNIFLEWTPYHGVEEVHYVLERKTTQNEWETLDEFTSDVTSHEFVNDNVKKRHCLRIVVKDACGNLGKPSNIACVILLEGGNLPRANSIKWSRYEKWQDSVDHYTVYRSIDSTNWYPVIQLEKRIRTFVDTNLIDDIYTYCYKVEALEKQGGFEATSVSNTVCVAQKPVIFIPNAFTPGISENINDGFGPRGSFLPDDYTMQIFSRWGQRIFLTNQGEDWDGTVNGGELAPLGVYLYIITFTGPDGELQQYEGSVKLIR